MSCTTRTGSTPSGIRSGPGTMGTLFSDDILLFRRDTRYYTSPTLTEEQAKVRADLHGLLSRGGTADQLENFQPVLMPEAFLDELYDTYGDDLVWDSLGPITMGELFGDILISRGETRLYTSPQLLLTDEQAKVRADLHALLARGGNINELEDFRPVLMPEAFLDELYETYGDDLVWDSLGPITMGELFGDILISRGETPLYQSTTSSNRRASEGSSRPARLVGSRRKYRRTGGLPAGADARSVPG